VIKTKYSHLRLCKQENAEPSLVIHTLENDKNVAHVLPIVLIEDCIEGRKDFKDIEGYKYILRKIAREWLDELVKA